jgi:hypothetical protein
MASRGPIRDHSVYRTRFATPRGNRRDAVVVTRSGFGALPAVTGSEAKDGNPPPQATVGNGGSSHNRAAATRHRHESTLPVIRWHSRPSGPVPPTHLRRHNEWCEAASEHLPAILPKSVCEPRVAVESCGRRPGSPAAQYRRSAGARIAAAGPLPHRLYWPHLARNSDGPSSVEDRAPGPV